MTITKLQKQVQKQNTRLSKLKSKNMWTKVNHAGGCCVAVVPAL